MTMFIRQKDEYRAKAPCIPRLDTNEGTALTEINREILSRTPRRPQPRLVRWRQLARSQFSTTETRGRKLMESLVEDASCRRTARPWPGTRGSPQTGRLASSWPGRGITWGHDVTLRCHLVEDKWEADSEGGPVAGQSHGHPVLVQGDLHLLEDGVHVEGERGEPGPLQANVQNKVQKEKWF